MNDEQIQKILIQHKKNAEYRKNYYNKRYSEDEKYRTMKIEKSREHYKNNNEKRIEKYSTQKDRINAERRYRYALKRGDNHINKFKEKYENDYNSYIKNILD